MFKQFLLFFFCIAHDKQALSKCRCVFFGSVVEGTPTGSRPFSSSHNLKTKPSILANDGGCLAPSACKLLLSALRFIALKSMFFSFFV